jgi:hypothetical protein
MPGQCRAFSFGDSVMKQFTFNKAAVFAVFNDADNSSASFADRLLSLGIASRVDAKPLAMEWALAHAQSKKLDAGVKLVKGQRGLTFSKRDTAASPLHPHSTSNRNFNQTFFISVDFSLEPTSAPMNVDGEL